MGYFSPAPLIKGGAETPEMRQIYRMRKMKVITPCDRHKNDGMKYHSVVFY